LFQFSLARTEHYNFFSIIIKKFGAKIHYELSVEGERRKIQWPLTYQFIILILFLHWELKEKEEETLFQNEDA
jgi:hypothetical protein